MVEEAEFSSITRQTLLEVDARLNVAQVTGDIDRYQLPVLTPFKEAQPILFEYVKTRTKAVAKYHSVKASSGYPIGTALGYDIMTSHIASLGRTVDVTPLHMATHDPLFVIALMTVAMEKQPAIGDRILNKSWFEATWANYRFTSVGELKLGRATPELKEFAEQVNKAPTLLDYLGHLHLFFGVNPEEVKQAAFTGIIDQMMIYRHRLEDIDGPDQRYVISGDGTKIMPNSPADMIYAKQQAFKFFGRKP